MPKTAAKYAIFTTKPATLDEASFSGPPRQIHVVKRITLTDGQYRDLTNDLLRDRSWIASVSTRVRCPDVTGVLEIRCKGKKTLYIDHGGNDYAKYVGIAW
jgi:hypothetical protein